MEKPNIFSKTIGQQNGNQSTFFPQLVISSNRLILPEWANTRIKRVEFDVQFMDDKASKKKLHSIITQDNNIFKIFAFHYMKLFEEMKEHHSDELYYSREAFKNIYKIAGRKLPPFFPHQPAEDVHDPARIRWYNLIFRHEHAWIEKGRGVDYISFREGMARDVREYMSLIPQHIKKRREGLRIIIENPVEFKNWLKEEVETLSRMEKVRFKISYYHRGN